MRHMETKEIIRRAGGARAVASKLGISFQAVYLWRDKIPAHHVYRMAVLADMRPESIRPDMFEMKAQA